MRVQAELARLEGLTTGELRETYAEVFGETTRTGNKRWLIKRIIWRMQANAEGGLSERARRRAVEIANDADLRTTIPKGHAANGESSVARTLPTEVDQRLPMPGTELTRAYKGRTIRVLVLPKGFEWEGTEYGSLSAVAKAVTGSHWNGFRFFGLDRRTAS